MTKRPYVEPKRENLPEKRAGLGLCETWSWREAEPKHFSPWIALTRNEKKVDADAFWISSDSKSVTIEIFWNEPLFGKSTHALKVLVQRAVVQRF